MFKVGIDIAKRGHVAAVVDQDGKLVYGCCHWSGRALLLLT